ncbi:collagen alpha-1(I) chain-like [Canis lupus familiaris]|uniref:collagen alpha-1(I) chain-like n=1 Tax=Canis lupus familiaris TaxID=9615 RepID=UPI0018F4728B|nr:collagen alpha-1(I) chain-like [Canis lupus familiaris]
MGQGERGRAGGGEGGPEGGPRREGRRLRLASPRLASPPPGPRSEASPRREGGSAPGAPGPAVGADRPEPASPAPPPHPPAPGRPLGSRPHGAGAAAPPSAAGTWGGGGRRDLGASGPCTCPTHRRGGACTCPTPGRGGAAGGSGLLAVAEGQRNARGRAGSPQRPLTKSPLFEPWRSGGPHLDRALAEGAGQVSGRRKPKAKAPPPPAETKHLDASSDDTVESSACIMEQKENTIDKDIELLVVLPGDIIKSTTVHGSKPMMDLLIFLCAQYHLNPSSYTIDLQSAENNPLKKFKKHNQKLDRKSLKPKTLD